MDNIITFIIPVRHPANSNNWGRLKNNLTQTAASIAAQQNLNWRAVIVANYGADLPVLPPGFETVRVDFLPNDEYEYQGGDKEIFYDAIRLDKGRRVLMGMLHIPNTLFYMVVDDDDFVSNKIVDFVSKKKTRNGWKIDKGYVWGDGGKLLFEHDDFANFCGTSLIIRSDLYQLPDSFDLASDDYIKTMLGSHIKIAKILESQEHELESLPFRGAVYRVGHAGAHSKSPNILKMYFFNRSYLFKPFGIIKNLFKLRILNTTILKEFFGKYD